MKTKDELKFTTKLTEDQVNKAIWDYIEYKIKATYGMNIRPTHFSYSVDKETFQANATVVFISEKEDLDEQ